jgi:tetratricopeptide (TPR) repeat protein
MTTDRAQLLKKAEEHFANKQYVFAANLFGGAGETARAKECWIKEAEGSVTKGEYDWAAAYYKRGGEHKKAKECWTKEAKKRLAEITEPGATIEGMFNDVVHDTAFILARSNAVDTSLEVLMSEEGIGVEEAKYKIMELLVDKVRYDIGIDSVTGIGLTDQKLCIKFADKCVADGKGGNELAAEFYKRGGDIEKANAMFVEVGDKQCTGRWWNVDYATKYYTKAGMTEEQANARAADNLFESGRYEAAAEYYKKIGNTEKGRLSSANWAEQLVAEGKYSDAVGIYKKFGYSLSNVPNPEKLLEAVKQGSPEAIQKIAELVTSEEDEVIFNEARAGMVL